MGDVSQADILGIIQGYQDPHLNRDLVSLDTVKNVSVVEGRVTVDIVLGYPAAGIAAGMSQILAGQIEELEGVNEATVNVGWKIEPAPVQGELESLAQVGNIVAVASGKGGVGKSTTAVNLALALAAEGARVGILDADIYGPSVGLMLGVTEGQRPEIHEEKFFVPIEAHGLQSMSMAFLVDDNTPMVWRGPMVSGALQQLLNQSKWDKLDYLIVDMPPGTGDIQLTLAQRVPVTGAVIVTTPQDLALLDARKGIEMFTKVNVPVLGVVENMAVHTCSQCGHTEHLFGEGGGERLAEGYGVNLLGSLPLSMAIREQVDGGKPTVVAEPESQLALLYRQMARQMAAELAQRCRSQEAMPLITISDD